jgi:hypothetical protein
MKKLVIFATLFLIIFSLISVSATIDSEMQKVTYYAEEYETGNINYAQLLVYLSSAHQTLNSLLGATNQEYGGILKQEQIENILGKSQHETKWVWVQNEERERKVNSYLPVWEKIVFDGKKISIKLHANPFLFKETSKELKEEIWKLEEQGKFEEAEELKKTGEEKIGYNLNFETDFKKSKDSLNVGEKIKEIQSLAEAFNKEPSKENAENLAEESVNVERSFETYFRQNSENCEDYMKSLFGSEYLRETAGILSYQINFYEGENFEAIIKLEMCEECQWNWINLNMWYEGRGRFKLPEVKFDEENIKKEFENKDSEYFETETAKLIESMKNSLQQGDLSSAMKESQRLNVLTNAWNEKSNNVWKQAEELIKVDDKSMTDKEREEFNKNYGWLKLEQQRREKRKELQKENLEKRKMFYLSLFAGYDYKESYAKQTEYEKRLIQEFKIFEQEKCDNNQDDNQNGEIDCADSECSGKFCGTIIGVDTEL